MTHVQKFICAIAVHAIHDLIGVENACPFSTGAFSCMYRIVVECQCFVDRVFYSLVVQLGPLAAFVHYCRILKVAVLLFVKLSATLLSYSPKVHNALKAKNVATF